MKTYINIKKRREALKFFYELKEKEPFTYPIRIDNVELRKINRLLKHQIFKNNRLYIEQTTLIEIMKPVGGRGAHNYHGLSPEQVLNVFNNILNPYCVFVDGFQKYAIITSTFIEKGEPILIVIKVDEQIMIGGEKGINKVITMFPKKKANKFIESLSASQLLYKNDYRF